MEDDILQDFMKPGQNIKKQREKRKISINTMSQKTGIRKEYLQKIEQGKALRVKITQIALIANVFKIHLSELFVFES